jgi:predicted secreted protein
MTEDPARRMRTITMAVLTALTVMGAASLGGCGTADEPTTTGGGPTTTSRGATVSTTPGTARPTGTSAAPGTTAAAGTVNVDVTGDTTVDAMVGQTIELEVAANASTGYTWSAEVSGTGLAAEGSRTVAPADPVPGRPGTEIFSFAAEAAGTSTVTLTSKQAGSGAVGSTFAVTVNVT